MGATALIKCCELVCGYTAAVTAPLSFVVEAGDYLCVVGENGAGKSTLLKTLLGLSSPLGGSIEIGEELKANEIGYLPQQTLVQRDFPASVREIVISGCQSRCGLRPFYSREEKAVAEKNMERLGIIELKNRCYRELSGGQQQRVLLARALCASSKLLMLDEPAAGLDPGASREFYRLTEALNKNDGISVIMISHDVKAALRYADHILHVGKRPFYGSLDEYLESPAGRLFAAEEGETFYD